MSLLFRKAWPLIKDGAFLFGFWKPRHINRLRCAIDYDSADDKNYSFQRGFYTKPVNSGWWRLVYDGGVGFLSAYAIQACAKVGGRLHS